MTTYAYTVDGVAVSSTSPPWTVQARAAELAALILAGKPASTITNGGILYFDEGWLTGPSGRTPASVT